MGTVLTMGVTRRQSVVSTSGNPANKAMPSQTRKEKTSAWDRKGVNSRAMTIRIHSPAGSISGTLESQTPRRLDVDAIWKRSIWHQFGASIDTLDNAVRACPDELWRDQLYDTGERQPAFGEFWYLVYHTLFWLDLYLTGTEEGFVPPAPFTLIEQDDFGPLPERPYTKEELRAYLDGCRQRCQATIEGLSAEAAERLCWFGWGEVTFAELLLYSMRHVQGHAAQLALRLAQQTGSRPGMSLLP